MDQAKNGNLATSRTHQIHRQQCNYAEHQQHRHGQYEYDAPFEAIGTSMALVRSSPTVARGANRTHYQRGVREGAGQ